MSNSKNQRHRKYIIRRWLLFLGTLLFAAVLLLLFYLLRPNPEGKPSSSSLGSVPSSSQPSSSEESQPEPPESSSSEEPSSQAPQSQPSPPSGASGDWNLLLVNPQNPLPSDFSVDLTQLKNGYQVESRAYPALQDMMDDARAAGLSPIICSAYRSVERQTTLYNNKVQEFRNMGYDEAEAKRNAAQWVAVPGTSEHHTGLAMDIVAESYQSLDKQQEQTAEQKWLMTHCAEYGFILRFPEDKSEITGIAYEPWHYRYVGKEAAQYIMEHGICLEEYLAEVGA